MEEGSALLATRPIWSGGWSKENQVAAHVLLAEYHDIFSLEPGELGCTDLVRHEIRVVDDEPFNVQV